MASFPDGPILEIHHGHKREQSQDSGAYIDWNSEDSASPTGNNDKGDFVTVVAVESGRAPEPDDAASPFVTVLEINDDENNDGTAKDIVEDVLVYRLPGERLGFGLKFEGGTNTAETVKRLFIQSSAPDSPASRAECSWGSLVEGDEIIKIDGHEVRKMTRLDCVRCLKESSVVIKLCVRHPSSKATANSSDKAQSSSSSLGTSPLVISAEMKKKVPPPPPIPPRKIPRKTTKDETNVAVVGPPEGFCDAQKAPVPKVRNLQQTTADETKTQSKSSVFVPAKDVKAKRSSFDLKHIPPEPEVYLDILAQEDVKNNWESESDDTGSTISTVMGFSLSTTTNSSFSDLRSNCDSTTPSTPTSTPSTPVLDVAKVLIPQQNSTETSDFLFTKLINDKGQEGLSYDEKSSVCGDDITPLQPPLSFQDAPLSYGNEEIKAVALSDTAEVTPRSEDVKNLAQDEEDGKQTSPSKKTSLIPRLAKSIGLLSPPKPSPRSANGTENGKSRSGKKRPPPPPPPPPRTQVETQQETKSQKTSSIPYLKKKTKSGKGEGKKSKEESTTTLTTTVITTTTTTSATEKVDKPGSIEVAEEIKDQDQALSWPVPELRTRRQDGSDNRDLTDGTVGSDANGSLEGDADSDGNGSRDSYFLFQWGSSKHLETIGEDEEDVCNDESNNGQQQQQPENEVVVQDTEVAGSGDAAPERVDDDDNDDGKDGSVIRHETPAEQPLNEDVVLEAVKKTSAGDDEDSNNNNDDAEEDGDKVGEGEQQRKGEENQVGDQTKPDLTPAAAAKLSDKEVASHDLRATESNGDLKESMVPIATTATVGLAPPPPSQAPPAFGRLPPDGHEFPQNYREETLPVMPVRDDDLKQELLPPLPTTEPPAPQKYSFRVDDILPNKKTFPADDPPSLTRASRPSFWRQDERSEKSVRDKIAMFSSVSDVSPMPPANSFCSGKLSKYKSSDDVFYDDETDSERLPNGKHFSRSIVTIDKIGGSPVRSYAKKTVFGETPRSLDYANRTQSSMDLTSSSSSAYSSSCSPDSSLSSTTSSYLGYSSTLPRKSSVAKTEASASTKPVTRATSFSIHGRSQSLLDINPSPYKSRFRTDGSLDDEQKQSSLNLLIEQRRKNLSKLRGLVIPEKAFTDASQPILDLPEIKSRDLILTSKLPNAARDEPRISQTKWESPMTQSNSTLNLSSPPWKAQNKTPNVPKYSPAFKRKTISVYGSAATPTKKTETTKPPAKPPRSLQVSHYESYTNGKPSETKYSSSDMYASRKSVPQGKYRSPDVGRSEEDSDNDSAVSSSRSSISHGFSPPSSPLLDNQHQEDHRSQLFASPILSGEKSPLIRTLSSETTASGASNTSTLTSGSQASCSSNGGSSIDFNSKRILKPQSVEAINRKNVLASAKYSRGFDAKSGSPLIQRKFLASDEDGNEDDKESVLSFESTHTIESYPRKYSGKSDTINYKLATSLDQVKTSGVKIAFMNDVEEVDGIGETKKRLTKTESNPCQTTVTSHTSLRRTSAPFVGTGHWNADSENGHVPLTAKPSTESLRSRASSVDTIIETATMTPTADDCRVKTARATIETDTKTDKVADLYAKLREKDTRNGAVPGRSQRSVSVNDIRKAFEKVEAAPAAPAPTTGISTSATNGRKVGLQFGLNGNHIRVSSLDSTNSEDSCAFGPGQYGSSSNLHREQFGSITSLASSTSLISPQELQLLIDEANQTLEESGGCTGGSSAISHDVLVVILHRDTAGGSVGITLAGGADYESKEITVHKVLTGSPADRDGRIQKGDRILSINGKSMKGATHRESLAILKSPRPEVVLVVSRPKADGNSDAVAGEEQAVATSVRSNLLSSRPPRILEGTTLNDSVESASSEEVARGPPTTFILLKDGAGLGFSLEGGKDSPVGDKPLVIKKIFTGGSAEKCGHLKAGDEILNVNGIDVTVMSRIEAWKLMKRIPDGNVSITVRRQVENNRVAAEAAR